MRWMITPCAHRLPQYKREYGSHAERAAAFAVFRANLARYDAMNHQHLSAGRKVVYGVDQFADMTPEAWAATWTPPLPPPVGLDGAPVVSHARRDALMIAAQRPARRAPSLTAATRRLRTWIGAMKRASCRCVP